MLISSCAARQDGVVDVHVATGKGPVLVLEDDSFGVTVGQRLLAIRTQYMYVGGSFELAPPGGRVLNALVQRGVCLCVEDG